MQHSGGGTEDDELSTVTEMLQEIAKNVGSGGSGESGNNTVFIDCKATWMNDACSIWQEPDAVHGLDEILPAIASGENVVIKALSVSEDYEGEDVYLYFPVLSTDFDGCAYFIDCQNHRLYIADSSSITSQNLNW